MHSYCAVIRTLGLAGDKYLKLLQSLISQTIKPRRIIVYIAEGYENPKETVGEEQIVHVPKGMVAQRALPYDEVDTEWMLVLDDDVAIEPHGVERLFADLDKYRADVIGCDFFPHHNLPFSTKVANILLLSSLPRIGSRSKGYTVNALGTDCYNPKPAEIAWSTTNAGPAFLCRKKDFLKIRFEDDLWLDEAPYAIPEDSVMFYKMHLLGLKILTSYRDDFIHLDGQTSITNDRMRKIVYSQSCNNYIFFKKYVEPNLPKWQLPVIKLLRLYQAMVYRCYSLYDKHGAERRKGIADAKKILQML